MKIKIAILFVLIGLSGLFASCEGPMGPEGPAGVASWDVFEMKVKQGDWRRDKEKGVFFYRFEDRRLDKFTVENGLVHVELLDGGAYYPLPLTEYIYDAGYFAETISFVYGVGWIEFMIGASDLFDNVDDSAQPSDHLFKVSLLWR